MKTTDVSVTRSALAPEVSDSMRSLTWIAFPLALGSACLEDDEPTPVTPRIFFVSVAHGDTISTDVRLDFGAIGFRVKPAGGVEEGAGYLTLFIDEPCVPAGEIIRPSSSRLSLTGGETFVELALDPGRHRFCLQASDGRGVALGITSVLEVEAIEASVRIVSPQGNQAVPSKFTLKLAAEGVVIEPAGEARIGAGHFYVLIDEECPPESFPIKLVPGVINLANGETEVELELPFGTHEVWVGIADGEDVAMAPRTMLDLYVNH